MKVEAGSPRMAAIIREIHFGGEKSFYLNGGSEARQDQQAAAIRWIRALGGEIKQRTNCLIQASMPPNPELAAVLAERLKKIICR